MNIQDIQYLRQETGAGMMDCKNALLKAKGDLQQSLMILQEMGFQLAQKKEARAAADGIAYARVYDNRAVLVEVNTETDFVSTNAEFIAYVERIAGTIAQLLPDTISALLLCQIPGQDLTVTELLQKMVLTFREKIEIRRFEVWTGELLFAYMHQNGRYGVILKLTAEGPSDHNSVQDIGKELVLQIAAMAPRYISRSYISEQTRAAIKARFAEEITADPKLSSKTPQQIEKIISGKAEKFYHSNCLLEQKYIKDDSLTVKEYIQQASAGLGVQIDIAGFCRYEKAEGMQDTDGQNILAFARQMAHQ